MGRSPFWTAVFQLLFLTTPNRLVGAVRRRFHPSGERAQWVRNLTAAASAARAMGAYFRLDPIPG
jgi:hypothetical protein